MKMANRSTFDLSALPFSVPGNFYKGNLHTHCTESDGDYPAEEVIRRYQEKGYHFLALSDHFLECYGFPVTDTRELRSADFTTLISAELHTGNLHNGETWHVLAVGLPLDFAPPEEHEGIESLSKRAFDAGAYIGLVHPRGMDWPLRMRCFPSPMPLRSTTTVPKWRTIAVTDGRFVTCF